ncbi:hypothetical protein [Sphingomonas koreensis]
MDSNEQSLSLTTDSLEWVTTTHFLLIGLFAIGAVMILIWGRHLRRARLKAEEEVEANNEIVEDEAPPPPER